MITLQALGTEEGDLGGARRPFLGDTMRRSPVVVPLLAVALVVTACDLAVVEGSGQAQTESREVTAFSKVYVADAMKAVVSEGPATVRVTGDGNLLQYVETRVEDGVLTVSVRDWVTLLPTQDLVVRVYTPELIAVSASGASTISAQAASTAERFAVEASGASHVEVTGLVSPVLDARASGASNLVLSGISRALELELSGASTGCLTGLSTDTARVILSGASNARIVASTSVAGDLSGASDLDVAGDPDERSVHLSGGSSIAYR